MKTKMTQKKILKIIQKRNNPQKKVNIKVKAKVKNQKIKMILMKT